MSSVAELCSFDCSGALILYFSDDTSDKDDGYRGTMAHSAVKILKYRFTQSSHGADSIVTFVDVIL